MKTLITLLLLFLFGTAHADFLTNTFSNYDASYDWTQTPAADLAFPISQTFDAQNDGPALIQGYILLGQGDGSYAVIGTYIDILLDGVVITPTPLPFWNFNNYFAITVNVTAGSHTVTFRRRGTGTYNPSDTPAYYNSSGREGLGALLTTILPNDPLEGFQTALDQLRDELLAADAALRADLLAIIQNVENALQAQIAALTARVVTLENSQSQQDAIIAQLQSQVGGLQSALTQLQSTVQQLQEQIANLPTPANFNPAYLQSQINALKNQSPSTVTTSSNDNAWWGVVAGAGAGIGVAVIANQFSSRGEAAANTSEYYETR